MISQWENIQTGYLLCQRFRTLQVSIRPVQTHRGSSSDYTNSKFNGPCDAPHVLIRLEVADLMEKNPPETSSALWFSWDVNELKLVWFDKIFTDSHDCNWHPIDLVPTILCCLHAVVKVKKRSKRDFNDNHQFVLSFLWSSRPVREEESESTSGSVCVSVTVFQTTHVDIRI